MRRFVDHGYVGTSMDMLVADVGGSKATLYRHFPTKADLVRGLMERVASTIGSEEYDAAESTASLEEELTAIGRRACSGVWSESAAAVLRLTLGEYNRFPELARTVWESGPTRTYANFHAFVAERERRGEVDVDDPQIAAEQFLGGIVGHQQLKIAFGLAEPPTEDETEARVREAVRGFVLRYGVEAPVA
ncbi:MAG: TetR family transcriptional regulator [Acidimicrobiales bacterium]|nr:MAG: TetR family transcriptional regulator [Acidimicrobiales bacterium]